MSRNRRARQVAAHVRTSAALERGLRLDMIKIFRRIAKAAAEAVRNGNATHAPNVAQHFEADIRRVLYARMTSAALRFARMTFNSLAAEKSGPGPDEHKLLDLIAAMEKLVRDWLSEYGAKKVKSIVETTRNAIRRILVSGAENHEPPRVIAKRIVDDLGGDIAKRRAETIARTEIGTANSVGSDEAAKITGLTLEKVWNATEDHRTRPDHAAADGQRVGMEASFTLGGVSMKFPRDPDGPANQVINCRCVCTYEPKLPG